MTNEEFEAFKKAWEDYPSQDNEGYQPDRGGFKCGWAAALEWEKQQKSDFAYIDQYEAHRYLVSVIKNLRDEIEELKRQK